MKPRIVLRSLIIVALLGTDSTQHCFGQGNSTYTAAEAAKHVNENATVRDKVENVHQSGKGNVFLNLGGHYPNQLFTAFIPATSASSFSDFKRYDSKTISVTGKIALYHGKPEIVVTSLSQIKIEE